MHNLFRTLCYLPLVLITGATLGQPTPLDVAEPGQDMDRVWHLGRVTGDLERIIHFYHDLLGLGFRGNRDADIPFYSVDAINEFVNAPDNAEFRAAIMPIQGTSNARDPAEQIYLEAFEYRNITRHQVIPALTDIGVSSLVFLVHDLDALIATLDAEGVPFITPDKQAVVVPTPAGYSGTTRSVLVRDPDGYPVELMEVTPLPLADVIDAPVISAQMSLVVSNLGSALDFYRTFIGPDLQTWTTGGWQSHAGFSSVRNIDEVEFRTAGMLLPGSAIVFQLVEYRGITQGTYQPVFQDIGFGHIAFMTPDIEEITRRMAALGSVPLSQSRTWTQISPTLRAVYTRDQDGFFLEIIE